MKCSAHCRVRLPPCGACISNFKILCTHACGCNTPFIWFVGHILPLPEWAQTPTIPNPRTNKIEVLFLWTLTSDHWALAQTLPHPTQKGTQQGKMSAGILGKAYLFLSFLKAFVEVYPLYLRQARHVLLIFITAHITLISYTVNIPCRYRKVARFRIHSNHRNR